MRDYMAGLNEIVDVSTLQSLHGDTDFDFEVRVPGDSLYEITEKLADLAFRVHCDYEVRIATLAVPV